MQIAEWKILETELHNEQLLLVIALVNLIENGHWNKKLYICDYQVKAISTLVELQQHRTVKEMKVNWL